MLDGILLEQAGLPAAVLLTEPFARSGEAMAAAHGAPGFPYVLTPHPINVAPDASLQEWAEGAAEGVVRILLGQ